MSRPFYILGLAILLTLSLQSRLFQVPPAQLPQLGGHNILEMLLGETRQLISHAFLEKADDYLHGGVKHTTCDGDAHDHADAPHAPTSVPHTQMPRHSPHRDPWSWLNQHLHVQEHRHLSQHQAQELLPWLQAACYTDPHNIAAFETTAYTLERMLHRPHEATNVLQHAIQYNPTSASLELSLAEILLRSLKDIPNATQAFANANRKVQLNNPKTYDEQSMIKGRALFYLGHLALQTHDLSSAQRFLHEAQSTLPRNVATRDLQRLLDQYQAP